ncbi:MAG: acyclic terpene utilization AtuA family protein [Nocardioides sp.]|nr:acyclic terpene utilization AtuA family protein [Nocardioides sp.]
MSPAPLRIGNCSGFYGDRLSAMRELLEGEPGVDVITGDYLAELTMLILGKDRMRDASLGYARTFVTQLEDSLGLALERGVRIVANAGGLNPAGLADRVREVARGLGLDPAVAHVEGDDLLPRAADLGLEGALTANAYLGAFGIAAALDAGADIVVTGRVTDASVVVGPAISHFGWDASAYDELAGAVVAGHVIECGTQATGGNFSGFLALPRDTRPLGFPVAEVAADGSSVITKQDGTGGVVTVDTVTAQLVYEIQTGTYLNPDVSVDLTSVELAQDGEDRVAVTGVRGGPPPEELKVCVNELGGWRNSAELVLTGLAIGEKADWLQEQVEARWSAGTRPTTVDWTLARTDRADADTEECASARLRCTVLDPEADPVGKAFTSTFVELALASYPGFTLTAPPAKPTPYGVYRPAYVPRDTVEHVVVLPDGARRVVEDGGRVPGRPGALRPVRGNGSPDPATFPDRHGGLEGTVTRRLPLGTFVHARSGDKGGDANVGLWVSRPEAADAEQYDARLAWLLHLVTPDEVRSLLPETADLDVEVHPLPNLGAVNVLVRGLLGQGVAASTRFDPQAKAVGEWLRSRLVNIPEELM